MARQKGQFDLAANLEPLLLAPLDARTVVDTEAELTQAATWQDEDGNAWLYDGLVVSVARTGQLWMLTDRAAYTSPSAWRRVDAAAAGGVQSVSGSGAVQVAGDEAAPQVSLKLDGTGSVALSQSGGALKADYKPTADQLAQLLSSSQAGILKVVANPDQSASLAADFTVSYDSASKTIKFTGHNSASLGAIDASDFIKDGMVEGVELEGNDLVFTFNTDSGKDVVSVDLSKFIDVYAAGGGIGISGKTIYVNVASDEKYLELRSGALYSKGIDSAIGAAIEEAFGWHEA